MQVQKIKENSLSCFHVLHFKFHILVAQWTSKKCKSKEVTRGVTKTKTLENQDLRTVLVLEITKTKTA